MTYVYDASFGHAQITPDAMKAGGADGVILYAGCNDSRKNATRAEIHALLNAGFQVGLVIENFAADALGGSWVGTAQGRAILAAATNVGYDTANCVLFGGYDTDSHPADWPKLLDYMEAFAAVVPVPGYYGDSDSIDFLHARHPGWVYWQSDSRAFSPLNPTPNAHLLQLFNDPRAHGLPVDVNIVERSPLRLMGEDMALTDADTFAIWDRGLGADQVKARDLLISAQKNALAANTRADALTAQLASLAATVANLQISPVDPAVLAGLLAQHLALVSK